MARLEIPALEDMTDEERDICAEVVAGKRGHIPAPMAAWLRSPEYARRVQRLGEFLRYDTTLSPALSEMAILVVARHWRAHHEWIAHKKLAFEAGTNPEVIEAIAREERPVFARMRESVVYDIVDALQRMKTIPKDLYETGIRELGEKGMVELVGLLGFYTLVSMTLVGFEIGPPSELPKDF